MSADMDAEAEQISVEGLPDLGVDKEQKGIEKIMPAFKLDGTGDML